MTIFFLMSIILSALCILVSFAQIDKEGRHNTKKYYIIVFYMVVAVLRFVIVDSYIDSQDLMMYILFTLITVELISDIFSRQIRILPIIALTPIIIIYHSVLRTTIRMMDIVVFITIVLCTWIVKRYLNHVIGYGDMIMCGLLVLWTGVEVAMLIVFTSFVLNGVFCVVLFACRRVGKHTQIPFMPAMTLSFIIYLFGEVMVS